MYLRLLYEGASATIAVGLRPSIFQSIHVMYIWIKFLPVQTETHGSALRGARPDFG